MPEGHSIHYAARQQQRRLRGQALEVSSPQGRFQSGASKLNSGSLRSIEAFGKHLFYHWEDQRIVHVHLGLYGKFRWHKTPPPAPRGAVRLRMIGEQHTLDLHGPTACELMTKQQRAKVLARLGPAPLRGDADPENVWTRIHKSRAAIGKLLLDQSVVAGIGNVYRAELLFAAGICPERPGRDVTRDEFDGLWETICGWMKLGAKHNRIITTAATTTKPPARLTRGERLAVYKKEFCTQCEQPVQTWTLAARTIYACPGCQS